MEINDTIAAISTCFGEAGIGIIRLSGAGAFSIVSRFFHPCGKLSIDEFPSHTVHLGKILDKEKLIDEALLTVMKSPKSYTGENMAEISCHGGVYILRRTLEMCLENGARQAEPGEFTKRAFLNGKIDLSQAEAVCDVIKAKTESALSCAAQQLQGSLRIFVDEQKRKIVDLLATIEAGIDYSEDDIESCSMPEIISTILKSEESIENIISTFHIGKIFKEGVKTAIIGKPNVGKSSLLNILTGSDRAIVTEIPGTTRDLIEETVSIRGLPLVLVDTAGIRQHTSDAVEKIGVERAMNAANYADLVLFVADASRPLTADDEKIAECLVSKKVILVLNKSDLPGKITDIEDLGVNAPSVRISALKNTGIEELKTAIYGVCVSEDINLGDFLLTNIRHKTLLENVLKSLSSARAAALKGMSEEFIALDLRAALGYLGKITGEVTTEDILGVIFSRFCVGK